MKDPYRYFRVEARELVDALQGGVIALEGEPADRDALVKQLLRHAHTLKGAARVVGQAEIADRAHALEDALAGHATPPELLAQVDAIATLLARLAAPEPAGAAPADRDAAAEGPTDAEIEPRGPDLDALDRLLEALQDARGQVGALRRAPATRESAAAIAALEGHLERLGAEAHALRLVPASAVFAQLGRAVRDTARALGKRAIFEAHGGEHHLDGRVLALVRDALLHVVRNAVDHGIEDAEARAAQGKPPVGHVVLDVERRGHRLAFVCRDDGRGIDVEAVRRSAEQRALAPARDAAELIFEPGVTTRAAVTPLSGRGVGLDVARDVAARLHGDVAVHSEPGRGAVFTITVPVSLSSMPVLAIEAGALRAALPLHAVRRALRLEPGAAVAVGEREAAVVEGRALPFLRLAAWAGDEHAPDLDGGRTAVIVEADGVEAALGVSRLLGVAHVVLRPVPAIAGALPVLGASLALDGTPEPVLDPAALVAVASAARRPPGPPKPAQRSVLVVDDSLTTRMLEQSILESAGYRVDVACSGEEGLVKARAEPYDLFVVDVEMPGMDGFQFVERTRADPDLSSVPSIIVSSRASDDDKRRGAAAGARGWVVKGEFAQERFLDLVRGLVP